MSTLTHYFYQIMYLRFQPPIRQGKEIHIGKEEIKLFSCSDNIIYEENLADSMKQRLELVSESSKMSDLSEYSQSGFLHTGNDQLELK